MKYRVTICYDVEAGDQAEALLIASSNGGTIFLAAEVHALSQETHVSKIANPVVSETETKNVEIDGIDATPPTMPGPPDQPTRELLLDALGDCLDVLEGILEDTDADDGYGRKLNPLLVKARAALAKADGMEPSE